MAPEFDARPEMGTLHYDSRHRLTRVDRLDGSTVEYVYDHNDRRVLTRTTREGETHTRVEIEGLYLIDDGVASRVVFDEDRRLAVVPAAGDPVFHHFDRLGNVNVLSNGRTGAFVGHDEYTPYGRLFISMGIQPAFTFRGGRFSDGLELVLLGARHYRPALGRFLTVDPYLLINQDRYRRCLQRPISTSSPIAVRSTSLIPLARLHPCWSPSLSPQSSAPSSARSGPGSMVHAPGMSGYSGLSAAR